VSGFTWRGGHVGDRDEDSEEEGGTGGCQQVRVRTKLRTAWAACGTWRCVCLSPQDPKSPLKMSETKDPEGIVVEKPKKSVLRWLHSPDKYMGEVRLEGVIAPTLLLLTQLHSSADERPDAWPWNIFSRRWFHLCWLLSRR
jgi:hypothetical protein